MAGTADRSEGAGRRARLLLVYSESAQAAALVQRLLRFRYDIISSPTSALADGWVDELRPDLVLLTPAAQPADLLSVCRAVRSSTDEPVIVLSELEDELLVARALTTGIDDYLVLPIGERELVARIEAMLRRLQRGASVGETRRVAGLILSMTDHSVIRNGRRIYLSPIEFRLLACLASAPGRVLTHQTLMSRVWGAEYVDSRHYLWLYVRYLREKLEDNPTRPQLILSEWGVGYRLAADAASEGHTSPTATSRAFR